MAMLKPLLNDFKLISKPILNPIESIGNLKYVGGNLYLMYSSIQSLENLEYVGSNVYLSEDHQIPPEQLTKFHIISV